MDEEEINLPADLAALHRELHKYPAYPETSIPDQILYGFGLDVAEHAEAVVLLTAQRRTARAALANARAAIESAVDALFLVSDAALYARRGAQARVFEAFEAADMQRRRAKVDGSMPPGAQLPADLEQVLFDDANAWDAVAPGSGQLIRDFVSLFNAGSQGVRLHWSGLSKAQLYTTVFPASVPGNFGGMLEVMHGVLSIDSHSRPRSAVRPATPSGPDRLTVAIDPSAPERAISFASVACLLAKVALEIRREFSGGTIAGLGS